MQSNRLGGRLSEAHGLDTQVLTPQTIRHGDDQRTTHSLCTEARPALRGL